MQTSACLGPMWGCESPLLYVAGILPEKDLFIYLNTLTKNKTLEYK